uniref:Uncharacterized protein n=1 Tax=Romanomermis culicivorax TaxID=13658 RepID=A0A915KU54_ROMCU
MKNLAGWFGLRREFCQFLLGACPCLREYGNVSYRFSESSGGAGTAVASSLSAASGVASNGHVPANNQVSDAASICRKLDDQQQKTILLQNCSLDQPD